MSKDKIQSVSETVQLSSTVWGKCHLCQWRRASGDEGIAEEINHYIASHEYLLLHVGQQTSNASDGSPWHTTVAVLGK